MTSLKELQGVMVLLGVNIRIGPKLKYGKVYDRSDLSGSETSMNIVKDEVVDTEETCEVFGHSDGDTPTKQQENKKPSNKLNQEDVSQHGHEVNQKLYGAKECAKKKGIRIDCDECGKSFHRQGLKRHKDRVHKGITYGCGGCKQIYAFKGEMLRHCRKTGHDSSMIHRIVVDFP